MRREDVAKMANVSVMTVTRVVSGKGYVSEKTRKKVEDAIKKLNYIPNQLASGLVSRNSKLIAIVTNELFNPHYMHIIDSMSIVASKYGYTVSLFKTDEDHFDEVLPKIISNRVIGVVNLMLTDFPKYYQEQMSAFHIRQAFTGLGGFDVLIDYEKAIETAVCSLKEKGIKHPGFIYGISTLNSRKRDSRLDWFETFSKKYGIEYSEERVLYGDYPKKEGYIVGKELMAQMLEKHPECDAVFCLNDMMAFGAMNSILSAGKRIPEDIVVIGCDNTQISDYFIPALSTIGYDLEKVATVFVKYLIGEIENPAMRVKAEFIPRNTTKN